MSRRPPSFWYGPGGTVPWGTLLAPAGRVYGAAVARRIRQTTPHHAGVPVICVGNLTVGGTGKTPVALRLARMLRGFGETPVFLSRGYGGTADAPVLADPETHTAAEIGDEPLLLARLAPTIVSADRIAGAARAEAEGASVIIMDDGFQNPALHKDMSLVIVDGRRGFGNGRLFPAGPLREKPAAGFARADALILMDAQDGVLPIEVPPGLPLFRARLEPPPDFALPPDRAAIAFAGIGDPEKFFATLRQIGISPRRCFAFPDHHAYTPRDIERLQDAAAVLNAVLVTTEKDRVRLPAGFAGRVYALPVSARFDDGDRLCNLLRKGLAVPAAA